MDEKIDGEVLKIPTTTSRYFFLLEKATESLLKGKARYI
jgi:hypothetical protein